MLKIAVAQVNQRIADFENNTKNIKKYIYLAKEKNADVVIFSELSLCGYPPLDFLEFDLFISSCEKHIAEIAKESIDIDIIIGSPTRNQSGMGKKLYNSALHLSKGKIEKIIHKTLLPTYDVFDEYRYFEPNKNFECIYIKNIPVALSICEDLWNLEYNPLYIKNPVDELMQFHPKLIINIAASPFSNIQHSIRNTILSSSAKKYNLPLIYVNQIGANTELIFDGNSKIYNEKGEEIYSLKLFEEELKIYEFENGFFHSEIQNKIENSEIQNIHDALVLGIKDYFKKSGFTKAIVGLSGGIDSAIVTTLAAKALGSENILAVMMPSQYSSKHSINDSVALCEKLKIESVKLKIENIFNDYTDLLSENFEGKNADVTEENLQSRIRGNLLMALSNKHGYILLNTSNKSELATGYGTLYGDMCGGISVIGDLYKTQVYELVNYINKDKEIIPENIISKPPSAELRPEQKDSDSLPEYDILDEILYHYIEENLSLSEIISLEKFDESIVKKILKLVNTAEYKRRQSPPVLRVSARAFGSGRRMPVVAEFNF